MAPRPRPPYPEPMARNGVGVLVREWRTRRRISQLDLALEVGVSARHLSFVETGRSKPSPELVLALANGLDVPLREQNTLLLAAGYAPRFAQRDLDDPTMRRAKAALQRMLDAHDPYPGVVIDRQWNIVLANHGASAMTVGLPDHLLQLPLNVFRICLHPEGLAARTLNMPEWGGYLLWQLRRNLAISGDEQLAALLAEVEDYPNVRRLANGDQPDEAPLLVPLRLQAGDGELSLFTTLTTFGTPRDVTLDELAVELFFPEDDATDHALRGA